MPKPFQIGYYDDSQGPGGTTRYLHELLAGLPREEYHPVFFAPQRRPWHRELDDLGVEVITLDAEALVAPVDTQPAPPPTARTATTTASLRKPRLPRTVAWPLGLFREVHRLETLFRKRPVDLLHTNNCGAEPAPLAARRAGVPRVLGTWHVESGCDLHGERADTYNRWLERSSMRALHRAIAVSESTKTNWVRRCRLDERYAQRVDVVYNGVDANRLQRRRDRATAKASLGLDPNAPLIGSLGRLEEVKGYKHLIAALPLVLQKHPTARLVIGGRGSLQESLQAQATDLGVAHALHWAGFVRDVRDVLESLDLYAQPSLSEALGLGLIEALSMGVPAVVTRVGGMPEVVNQPELGTVVPVADPQSLAEAINGWLSNGSFDAPGAEFRAEVTQSRFDLSGMVRRTSQAYRSLLD